MRALMIAALFGVSCSAIAGSIHKCKGADGVFVYQQTPCETEEAHVGTREISARDREGPAQPAPSYYYEASPPQHFEYEAQPAEEQGARRAGSRQTANTGVTAGADHGELMRRLQHRRDSERKTPQTRREIAELEAALGMSPSRPRATQPVVTFNNDANEPPEYPLGPPQVRARESGAGTKFVDQYGTRYRAKPVPGTNQTRVLGPNGQVARCRTDAFGNTRCN